MNTTATVSSANAAPRRRIMLVTTSLMRGGAETQVFLLARTFARRGHAVHVVSMRPPEAYQDDLRELGITFTSLGMRSGLPDPRGMLRLARAVRAWRPDVVHSHMVHANLLARITRIVAPMPVLISTAHNLTEGARWRELAYRYTDRLATLSTNVSQAAVDRFVAVGAVPEGRMRFVPNGLEPASFAPDPVRRERTREALALGDRFTWLAVGRLEAQKDYPTMLAATAEAASAHPSLTVLVVSDGPERATLEALRAQLGLTSEQVRFLGARSDVPDLMRAADAYLMSSAWEGLPMVLLEAAAAHLPIVATDVGGNADIVLAERSGVLVPAHQPAALAAAMTRVMASSDATRTAWGAEGATHVDRHFLLDRVVDDWEALYEACLGAGSGDGTGRAAAREAAARDRPT
jgi:glycosyltransferase involved in cell wall biosynthesis